MKLSIGLIILLTISSTSIKAQERHVKGSDQVTYPEVSKQAGVSQTIGISTIEINYHRPKTLGRNLWGALIPFDKVWRAGANESTTISFTDNVLIEGKELEAGIYSLHMIPTSTNWTVIFSTNYTQWGSFYYDESEDALQIQVTPQTIDHQEALKYEFENIQDSIATIAMSWEKVKIAFQVAVKQNEVVIAEFRRNLQTLPRFRWFGNREAALYCVLNQTNIEEAITWIDRSLRHEEKFQNLIVKADLLRLQGNAKAGDEWEKKAIIVADTIDWVQYGYEAMSHHGRIDQAILAFKRGIVYYPESYILHRSLGVAYGKNREIKKAVASFDQAERLADKKADKEKLENYRSRYFLSDDH